MPATLDAIYGAFAAGDPVYVPLLGRDWPHWHPLWAACYESSDWTAVDAFAVIDRKWRAMEKCSIHPRSPEWPEQFAFIERWIRE